MRKRFANNLVRVLSALLLAAVLAFGSVIGGVTAFATLDTANCDEVYYGNANSNTAFSETGFSDYSTEYPESIAFLGMNGETERLSDDGISLTELIAREHGDFQNVNNGDRTSFVENSHNYATGAGDKKGEQLAADYIINRLMAYGYGAEGNSDAFGDNDNDIVNANTEFVYNDYGNKINVNTEFVYNDSNRTINTNTELVFNAANYTPTANPEFVSDATNNTINANPEFVSDDTNNTINANTEFVSDDYGNTLNSNYATTPLSQQVNDGTNVMTSQIIFQPFSEVFSKGNNSLFSKAEEVTIWSQNVILRFTNPATDKRIILGAAMDNDYSAGSHGAIQSGSGVAILLALSQMLQGRQLPFNVDIVFFGASRFAGKSYQIGAEHYCEKHSFGKIMLMANVGRIGGETTYVYNDEVDTKLLDYGLNLGLFESLPRSLPHLSTDALGGPSNFDYAHYGMEGAHARFMERGIPVLNFFCGDYDGLSLKDSEGSGNILGKDTVENMLEAYPDAYSKMMRVVAGLVSLSLNAELDAVVAESQAEQFDYSAFLHRYIAYLIMAGIVLIGFVVLVFVCRRLYAKHPPTAPKPKFESVFGTEYDKSQNGE